MGRILFNIDILKSDIAIPVRLGLRETHDGVDWVVELQVLFIIMIIHKCNHKE